MIVSKCLKLTIRLIEIANISNRKLKKKNLEFCVITAYTNTIPRIRYALSECIVFTESFFFFYIIERPAGSNRDKETVVQQLQVNRNATVHAVMTGGPVAVGSSSFAVPAVPNTTTVDTTVQSSADSTAAGYADVILKKAGVKRACSDPGYQYNHR